MKNIKSKFLSLTFAIIASLSLIVTSVAPAYAIEATSSTETETTTASETETTTETEEPEINSTLINHKTGLYSDFKIFHRISIGAANVTPAPSI